MLRIALIGHTHVTEDIVIQQNAVLVLASCLAVIFQALILSADWRLLEVAWQFKRRRIPLKGILNPGIRPETVVIGICVVRVSRDGEHRIESALREDEIVTKRLVRRRPGTAFADDRIVQRINSR
jgi:hypothetical protein